jgi:putative glutamine amidotransferase
MTSVSTPTQTIPARRPRIGITAYITDLDLGLGPVGVHVVPDDYVKAIWEAGGLPLLIPVLPGEASTSLIDCADGFLLTGGGDVDPALYGEKPLASLENVDPRRDVIESAIVRTSIDRNRPLLAVCRGVQMLNVALGGSLIPDLPSAGLGSHQQAGPSADAHHEVSIDPDSRISRVFGGATTAVNSFHHQAVRTEAPVLKAVAWASDGLVEAVELADRSHWVVGVQWHPEMMFSNHPAQLELFRALVAEARAAMTS